MGREKGVHKVMPYTVLLFDLLSCKEEVSFTTKGVANGHAMCEMFFPEGSKSEAAP